MSALSDLVAGLKAPSSPTGGTPNIGTGASTQNWNGMQIPGDIATKNLIAYDHATGNKTFQLPAFVGGGSYVEDANGHLVQGGHTTYGGVASQPGMQRDDIIPAGLGGANSQKSNIQMIPNAQAHQSDQLETQLSKQVKSGQVQPKEAIALAARNKPEIQGQAPSEQVSNDPTGLINQFGGLGAQDINNALGEKNPLKAGAELTLGLGKSAVSDAAFIPVETYKLLRDIANGDFGKQIDEAQKQGAGGHKDILSKAAGAANAFLTGLSRTAPLLAAAGASMELPNEPGSIIDRTKSLPSAVKEGIQEKLPTTKTEVPSEKVLASRIKDATPDYNKKMVAETTKSPTGETVNRVNEAKTFRSRTVNTSASEMANAKELSNIKDYPDKGTALQKSQAVHAEISKEAKGLKSALAEEDKTAPLVPEAKDIVYKNIFNNMDGDARTAVAVRGKGIEMGGKTGLSEADAQALIGNTPKTVLGKYGTDVADAMSEYNGSREGLLDLRQNLDDIYKDYRGKSAFGSDHRNALDDMHTNIRDYLNKELKESTTNTDTQASLDKQTRLFRAKDVLDAKAEKEGATFLGRHPVVKTVGRRAIIPLGLAAAGVYGARTQITNAEKKIGEKIFGKPTPKPKAPKARKIKL